MPVDTSKLKEIEAWDVHSHIYDVSSHKHAEKRLGYVDRKSEQIEISLVNSNVDLTITQWLSGLSASTGYVCWQTASYVTDWMLSDPKCPVTLEKSMTVVELGSGVGSVMVSLLGPRVGQYIATDQKPILKLLQHNFRNNVRGKYVSSTLESGASAAHGAPHGETRSGRAKGGDKKGASADASIDFVEFDWEYVDHGVSNVQDVTHGKPVDLVLACDTIYNEYLIPHFIGAFKSLMTADHTGVVVGLQVRDELLLELFAEQVLEDENMRLYCVESEFLSAELQGMVVYYVTRVSEDRDA